MGQNVSLQMVHLNHGNVQRTGESFGKRYAHQERAHQAGTACKSHRAELSGINSCPFQRSIHHGDDVLLMSATGKFRNHSAVLLMNLLAGHHIGQKFTVADYCSRRVIA